MASLEVANVLTPYADYMIASQELEPGGGWNYLDFMAAMSATPDIAPAELGKVHLRQLSCALHRMGR